MDRFLRRSITPIAIGIALLLLLAPAAMAQTGKRLITLDDLARIKTVSDPQRSPDGKWVAYVVRTADVEKDKSDSDLWMVSWDGTQTVRLTSGPDSESAPRWSPDGRYLAFLASRGTEDEKKKGSQLWLLDRLGGEAQKLTEIDGGVSDYSWSPDSKRFVFTKDDKDPADEPEKMEGWKRKTPPPIVIDRYHFKQDREGLPQAALHAPLRVRHRVEEGRADHGGPVQRCVASLVARRHEDRVRQHARRARSRPPRRTPTSTSSRRRRARSRRR